MADDPAEPKFKTGAVVILDALGTKGIWNRSETKSIIENWQAVTDDFKVSLADLHSDINRLKRVLQKNWVKIKNPDKPIFGECKLKSFSDTIIITIESDSEHVCLYYLADFLRSPFCRAVIRNIFFRGVISYGKYFQTNSLIIGPAVDEAAEWHPSADWIGISAAPSVNFILGYMFEQAIDMKKSGDDSLFKIMGENKFFVRYNVPLRNGEYNSWALNWPIAMTNCGQNDGGSLMDPNSLVTLYKSFAQ